MGDLTVVGLSPEGRIEGCKYLEDDETSKCWGKEVALGIIVFLDKRVEGSVGMMEKTLVGCFIHQIKVMDEATERGFRFDFVKGCLLPGHLIPTVDEVYHDGGMLR
jgi:hypothetical protein